MNVLVTGADGFVGKALCHRLSGSAHQFRCAIRNGELFDFSSLHGDVANVGDIGFDTDWEHALKGIDVVIHLAGRVHVMNESAVDPLTSYRQVNVAGTERLAQAAATLGVQRFIYLSSIKVNGESTDGEPFKEQDQPEPQDPYAVSKLEAEAALWSVSGKSDMEVVIIRPPLIYGPGVKGNFSVMLRWVKKGVPLPLGAVHNKRSLLALDNLVDFIITCIEHPAAGNQLFLVADGEDLSTTDLLRRTGLAINKPARLLPFPTSWMHFAAVALGREALAQRLLYSLRVDSSKACELLGWQAPFSVDEGLSRCFDKGSTGDARADGTLIRVFDVVFSLAGLLVTFPLLLVLTIIGCFDTGSPIFCQQRVGRHQHPFVLVKFRTMKLDTASVASHLASSSSITRFGHFLRRSKLDELPQLWNVLKGEMSLVGPRPCLYNQEVLIQERAERDVFDARPGITGLAQVNEIDMSTPKLLAETDQHMLSRLSVANYFRYIFQTVAGKGSGDRVRK